MESIELIRANLKRSEDLVLRRIEDMQDHCMIFPTPNGGCHTLWVLGRLAYIDGHITRTFILGDLNPLADWEPVFDADDVSGDVEVFPPFDFVLAKCREMRAATRALLDAYRESDLDTASVATPKGYDDLFGTRRRCFQFVADHWFMHRGHLADARRAARLERAWL